MLKLSRITGETIELFTSDGVVTIEFETIKFNNARVAIFAPKEVVIMRGELVNGDKQNAKLDLYPGKHRP